MADFLVWHQGPDDIHAAESWLEAVRLANQLNTEYEGWAVARTREFGAVTMRSWAVPYSVEAYRAVTGHDIDLSEEAPGE